MSSQERLLLERLLIAKYHLELAREHFSRNEQFAAGIAVSNLQDAVEIVLRALAESLHANVQEKTAFDQIINEINKLSASPLTHRSALNQLNKARVGFKHHGLVPRLEDAQKLFSDSYAFINGTVHTQLQLDFARLSLASLIAHRRTENWLNRAQDQILVSDWDASLASSATALELFWVHITSGRYPKHRLSDRLLDAAPDDIRQAIREFMDVVKEQQATLELLQYGVDLAGHRRFRNVTPHVYLTGALKPHYGPSGGREKPTEDDAVFCHRFVIDTALVVKRNAKPRDFDPEPNSGKNVTIAQDCDLHEWPEPSAAVFRQAKTGEVLPGSGHWPQLNGPFVAVVDDGEVAWVFGEFVEG